MISGSVVALVTPFDRQEVDYKSLERLVELHLSNKTNGILLCGSTGEGTSVTVEERVKIINTAAGIVNGRIPLYAGASCNNRFAIDEVIRSLNELKVDGVLVPPPFYIKPTQGGISEYFEYVAGKSRAPIILYNNPGRTSVNIAFETAVRLSKHANIKALKESSNNLEYCAEIAAKTSLIIVSGDDPLTYHIMNLGGRGVISVTANIAPSKVSGMCSMIMQHDPKAKDAHMELLPLSKVLFVESSPLPAKYLLRQAGLIKSEECRFPVGSLREESKVRLREFAGCVEKRG